MQLDNLSGVVVIGSVTSAGRMAVLKTAIQVVEKNDSSPPIIAVVEPAYVVQDPQDQAASSEDIRFVIQLESEPFKQSVQGWLFALIRRRRSPPAPGPSPRRSQPTVSL